MKELNTYHDETGGLNLPDSLRVNPFDVPPDFFKGQAENILSIIGLAAHSPIIPLPGSADIPEDYFSTLENNIHTKISELKLKEQVQDSGFHVPDQYFESFGEHVQIRLFEEKLKTLVPTSGFTIPDGYFDSNHNAIIAGITEDSLRARVQKDGFEVPTDFFEKQESQLRAIAAIDTQSGKDKNLGLIVPQGYFDEASIKIMEHIQSDSIVEETANTETTIIKFPIKRRAWQRYAAAAVAILVGMSAYMLIPGRMPSEAADPSQSTQVALNDISNDEIVKYLAQETEGQELIELATYIGHEPTAQSFRMNDTVEDEDIEEYLNYML